VAPVDAIPGVDGEGGHRAAAAFVQCAR
jgi:hypothetical protein